MTTPVAEQDRIESLDVLRGFALLGILLLNIIGFGLISTAYSNPLEAMESSLDVGVWAGVELFAEGAMRCLFSILFGAGVVLFTTGASGKGAALHYKRNFWLLAFGLFDAYVLLWNGDILVNYALAGAVLYWGRNASAKRLAIVAGVFIVLMSLMYAGTQFGMSQAQSAAAQVAASADPESLPAEMHEGATIWNEFESDWVSTPESAAAELAARRDSYVDAFLWNVDKTNEMLFFVMPFFLFWDALAMMLLGMALFKWGVLQGQRSIAFYRNLAIAGFFVGLLANGSEVYRAVASDFALLSVFAQAQATYHIGRLGMAMGWLGVVMLIVKSGAMRQMAARLAAVGRMALTNYLMHSFIGILVFTGAGFALVGELPRWQLYFVVLGIWLLQLWFSPWWLARYRYGPLEWLWRVLTYGKRVENRRV